MYACVCGESFRHKAGRNGMNCVNAHCPRPQCPAIWSAWYRPAAKSAAVQQLAPRRTPAGAIIGQRRERGSARPDRLPLNVHRRFFQSPNALRSLFQRHSGVFQNLAAVAGSASAFLRWQIRSQRSRLQIIKNGFLVNSDWFRSRRNDLCVISALFALRRSYTSRRLRNARGGNAVSQSCKPRVRFQSL